MDHFSFNESSSFAFDDECRDLGDFEDMVMLEDHEAFLVNDDVATHRGLAFEDVDTGNFLSALAQPNPVAQKAPREINKPSVVPSLTDDGCYVSQTRLYCEAGSHQHIVKAVLNQCGSHDCVLDTREGEHKFVFSHFSRAHLSIGFDVRLWKVSECSKTTLPDCPVEAAFVLEFSKTSGCSFRWMKLFSSIATAILKSGPCFFGQIASPTPDFSMALDDEDIVEDSASDLDAVDDLMHMLKEGTAESQLAAISACLHYCVTKQQVDQLVACGFLEVASTCMRAHHHHDELLRCILLVVSSVVALSDEGKFIVSQHSQFSTNEYAPLVNSAV